MSQIHQSDFVSANPNSEPAIRIWVRLRVGHGRLLTAANAHRIVARCTEPTDRMGNRLDKDGKSPIWELRNEAPYYQTWRIQKDKGGYSFREVIHGMGICGTHRTVRALVCATLNGSWYRPQEGRIVVEVEAEMSAARMEAA